MRGDVLKLWYRHEGYSTTHEFKACCDLDTPVEVCTKLRMGLCMGLRMGLCMSRIGLCMGLELNIGQGGVPMLSAVSLRPHASQCAPLHAPCIPMRHHASPRIPCTLIRLHALPCAHAAPAGSDTGVRFGQDLEQVGLMESRLGRFGGMHFGGFGACTLEVLRHALG